MENQHLTEAALQKKPWFMKKDNLESIAWFLVGCAFALVAVWLIHSAWVFLDEHVKLAIEARKN